MCDTPGQDDFDTLRPLVYPNTDVFLLCFSVVLPSSFHNIREKWIPEIRKSTQKNKKKIKSKNQKDDIPIILVGTQSDLRNDAQTLVELAQYKEAPISEAEARKLVQNMGFDDYIESSSLTQKNLKEVFDSAIMAGLKGRSIKEKIAAKQRRKISQKQQRGEGCLGTSGTNGRSVCTILWNEAIVKAAGLSLIYSLQNQNTKEWPTHLFSVVSTWNKSNYTHLYLLL